MKKHEEINARQDFAEFVPSRKIALVFGGTFGGAGGMVEYGRAWLDQLRDSGWNVFVIGSRRVLKALGEPERLSIDAESDPALDYRRIALTSLFGFGAAKRLVASVVRAIELCEVDAIHLVDRTLFTSYLVKGIKRKFPQIVTIVTIHDPIWHEERIARSAKILKARDDLMLARMAQKNEIWVHVHAAGLTQGSVFQDIRNVIAVDHPAPLARVTRTRRAIRDISNELPGDSPIRIGFVGRIEPYKGLDIFLDAVIETIENHPAFVGQMEIVIAGRGDVDQVRLGRVTCPVILRNEFIEDIEFHQLVADLDLLVLPYKSATQSGVAMLGLTYHIPMIVTNFGGLPLLVVDAVTGYVLKEPDAHELSRLFAFTLNHPESLSHMHDRMR